MSNGCDKREAADPPLRSVPGQQMPCQARATSTHPDATDAANGLIAVPGGGYCEDKKEIPRKMAVYVDSLLCANSLVQCRIDILLCILALGQKSMP